jgi:hypothetical protein
LNEVIHKPIGYNWPTIERNIGVQNLIANSDFRIWNGAQPLGWLTGLGTVSQETTTIRGTKYSVKITGANQNVNLSYYIRASSGASLSLGQIYVDYLRGKQVTCGAWIKSQYAGIGNVRINGYGASHHTGSNNWEWIGTTARIDAAATNIYFDIRASNGGGNLTGDIYVSEPICVVGISIPQFSHRPLIDGKAELMGPLIFAPRKVFTDGDTTPSVADGNRFVATYTTGATITKFDDGYDGHIITLMSTSATVTIQNNASIVTDTGADKALVTNKIYKFLGDVDRYREF